MLVIFSTAVKTTAKFEKGRDLLLQATGKINS